MMPSNNFLDLLFYGTGCVSHRHMRNSRHFFHRRGLMRASLEPH